MFTQTDLNNIEAAIREIISGSRLISLTIGNKTFQYTAEDGPKLLKMRDEIALEVGITAGTFVPRTYAKQGGRGR